MWALTTQNHAYAAMGSTYALKLADEIRACMELDRALTEELHTIEHGKWYGMGMSEHIGFHNWCEEECLNPIIHTFEPADKERMVVCIPGTNQHSEGTPWTGRVLTLGAFLDPEVSEGSIRLSTVSAKPVRYRIETESDALKIGKCEGIVREKQLAEIKIRLDRSKIKEDTVLILMVHAAAGNVRVRVPVTIARDGYEKGTFLFCAEGAADPERALVGLPRDTRVLAEGLRQYRYISIEAEHFAYKTDTKAGAFAILPDYGRTLSAVKAFPQDAEFTAKQAPSVSYRFEVPAAGRYTVRLYTNPSNPARRVPELFAGIAVNDGRMKKFNMVPTDFRIGDGTDYWAKGVLDNIRVTDVVVELNKGVNTLSIFALGPCLVLEKLVIFPEGEEPVASYLGPKETPFV